MVWLLERRSFSRNLRHLAAKSAHKMSVYLCLQGILYIYIYICCLTYLLHAAVILEKLIDSQLVKKLSSFYAIPKFITAFTSARHLSQPEPDQSSPCLSSHYQKFHLISSHLRLGPPSGLFPSGFLF